MGKINIIKTSSLYYIHKLNLLYKEYANHVSARGLAGAKALPFLFLFILRTP